MINILTPKRPWVTFTCGVYRHIIFLAVFQPLVSFPVSVDLLINPHIFGDHLGCRPRLKPLLVLPKGCLPLLSLLPAVPRSDPSRCANSDAVGLVDTSTKPTNNHEKPKEPDGWEPPCSLAGKSWNGFSQLLRCFRGKASRTLGTRLQPPSWWFGGQGGSPLTSRTRASSPNPKHQSKLPTGENLI